MAVYIVAENIGVRDQAGMGEYRSKVAATVEQYGGKFLVRGGAAESLEGSGQAGFVVIEFESAEKAKAWHDSPEYRPLIELRQRCADTRMTLVEGV